MAGGIRIGEALLGLVACGLAAFLGWGVATAPAVAARSVVGPGVFPARIALGLLAVGLRLLWEARPASAAPDVPPIDWAPATIVAGSLLAFILLLERLGWIVAGTLMFMAVARGFGSRTVGRDLLIGLALTTLTTLLFDTALGLSLPTGAWVEPILIGLGVMA